MAVEKSMTPSPIEADDDVGQVEVEIVNPDAVAIDTGEGGMILFKNKKCRSNHRKYFESEKPKRKI